MVNRARARANRLLSKVDELDRKDAERDAKAKAQAKQEEARLAENEEQKRTNERNAYRRLFAHQPGNEQWEYCRLHLVSTGLYTGQKVVLTYQSHTGEAALKTFDAAAHQGELEMFELASKLGKGGWELCSSTQSNLATGSREKHALEKGFQDFGRDATVATGVSTTFVMHFKRRISN